MKQLYLTILLFLIAIPVSAEKLVKGHVLDEQEEPIIGANIYWEGTQQGTTSDADGYFELKGKENAKNLVVSYIGYTTAVVPVEDTSKPLRIVLVGEVALQEVVISERKMGTIASRTSVLQTQKITYDEICRAACCNLAESFDKPVCRCLLFGCRYRSPSDQTVRACRNLCPDADGELPELPWSRLFVWFGLRAWRLDGKYPSLERNLFGQERLRSIGRTDQCGI